MAQQKELENNRFLSRFGNYEYFKECVIDLYEQLSPDMRDLFKQMRDDFEENNNEWNKYRVKQTYPLIPRVKRYPFIQNYDFSTWRNRKLYQKMDITITGYYQMLYVVNEYPFEFFDRNADKALKWIKQIIDEYDNPKKAPINIPDILLAEDDIKLGQNLVYIHKNNSEKKQGFYGRNRTSWNRVSTRENAFALIIWLHYQNTENAFIPLKKISEELCVDLNEVQKLPSELNKAFKQYTTFKGKFLENSEKERGWRINPESFK